MTIQGDRIFMIRGDTESLTVKKNTGSFGPGDELILTVRATFEDPIVLQKVVTAFTDGKAVFLILPGDTSRLAFGKYVYDVQWTDAGGAVRTIVEPRLNNFVLKPEVTY